MPVRTSNTCQPNIQLSLLPTQQKLAGQPTDTTQPTEASETTSLFHQGGGVYHLLDMQASPCKHPTCSTCKHPQRASIPMLGTHGDTDFVSHTTL
eukprot:1139176-Pelagomonas_calceolata.AAC.8